MRYLITGGSGQLGYDIKRELERRGETEVFTPNHYELDITNREFILKLFKILKPDVVFHSAAYTNVDKAEIDTDNCFKANVIGTDNMCAGAESVGAKIIGISSDYVFDGKKETPYEVDDKRNPLNYYGNTKKLAEDVLSDYDKSFIVRTSWVFGENGKNFVKTMLNAAEKYSELTVISDQIGSPTYTPDLANALIELAKTDYYGTYHMTNEGFMSWYEFCKLIYKEAGIDNKVNPILAKDYKGSNTLRPQNSMLSKECLDGIEIPRLRSVEEATRDYVRKLKK